MTAQQRHRRVNLLYRLRRHGIHADTRAHNIYIPCGADPWKYPQTRRLHQEFNFQIQLIIP